MPLAEGRLNYWAKKAGLLYFGAATDSPGQRERAGLEEAYPQYDAIFADDDTFGQTTPTNGQKVSFLPTNHHEMERMTNTVAVAVH
jgi:endo-1,4-beta-xylanase